MYGKMIICKECGEYKPHHRWNLCFDCYNVDEVTICKHCGMEKHISNFVICGNCLYGINDDDIKTTMYENKECSMSLGVVFCEKLLIDYFRNTTAMVNGNTGFDFVLDDGSKVDAKCSCLHGDEGNWYWTFTMNQNQIADYFCCVGVDNNDDRNVMCTWLIPSNAVSKKGIKIKDIGGIQIKRNDNHYEEYKLDLGDNDVEMITCYEPSVRTLNF